MRTLRCLVLAVTLAGFGALASCGGEEDDSGICVANYGIIVECFDCWKESDCTGSNRTWNTAYDSCPAAGYTNSTSNACGYTR